MRTTSRGKTVGLFLLMLSAAMCLQVPVAQAGRANLGTVTGAVLDNKGNPVAGAIISLMRCSIGWTKAAACWTAPMSAWPRLPVRMASCEMPPMKITRLAAMSGSGW